MTSDVIHFGKYRPGAKDTTPAPQAPKQRPALTETLAAESIHYLHKSNQIRMHFEWQKQLAQTGFSGDTQVTLLKIYNEMLQALDAMNLSVNNILKECGQ